MIINGSFMRYQFAIDDLIKSISTLYNCSCRPLVHMKSDGSFIQTEAEIWISEDAKKNYDQMQQNLRILLAEQALIQTEMMKKKKENTQ